MPLVESSWSLVIHGGAGMIERSRISADDDIAIRNGLGCALDAGAAILSAGGSALDAVEAAVRVLEDDPGFNAGRGAVFTYECAIELDAAIMEGTDRQAGAVAGATRSRNPVSLARAVMESSAHVFLAREGADAFAIEHGIAQTAPEWFETPERRRQLDEMKTNTASPFDAELKYGTVGAVACDIHGHVAAATSTGGLTGKRWARIGDSAVIGAGTYADDRSCAVSATGTGEVFIRLSAAHEVAARIRMKGEPAQVAAEAVIAEVGALGGVGGMIVVTPDGTGGFAFNTPGMHRGKVASDGRRTIAMYGDE